MLHRELKEAVSYLLKGKYVLAVLPTGFGRSLTYQSFVLAKEIGKALFVALVSDRPSCLVFVPGNCNSEL